MAFMSGVTGQFYQASSPSTIAISTVISAINSLTLSPALAAALLKPHGAPKDCADAPASTVGFGWVFRPFNRFFTRRSRALRSSGVSPRAQVVAARCSSVYAVLLLATGVDVPAWCRAGFIPTQDKLYLIAGAQTAGRRVARSHAKP